MIYALIFTVSGALDGTTLINRAIPAAVDTGVFNFTVTGPMGGIAPAMLQPLVGNGGFLLCGAALQVGGAGAYTAQIGLVGRTAGSVIQQAPSFAPFAAALPTQPPYLERPCYVPPFYRLCFRVTIDGGAANVVRIDIAPLRTLRQAARAMLAQQPNLLTPAAFP